MTVEQRREHNEKVRRAVRIRALLPRRKIQTGDVWVNRGERSYPPHVEIVGWISGKKLGV